jgi:two-component system NarL family sensor kinase
MGRESFPGTPDRPVYRRQNSRMTEMSRVSARDRRVATGVAVGCCLLVAVVLGLTAYALPYVKHGGARRDIGPVAVECLPATVIGLAIVRRHPRHIVGWLLVLQGLLAAPIFCGDIYAAYAYFHQHNSWPAGQWVAVVTGQAWPFLFTPLALLGYVFPTGRFLSDRWRRFAVVCLALQLAFMVSTSLTLTHFSDASVKAVPVPYRALPSAPFAPLDAIGMLAIAAFLVGGVTSAIRRLRVAEGEERLQLLWFATAAITIPGGLASCFASDAIGGDALVFLGVTLFGAVVPLTIGVAVLRHRLFDVELVLSRAMTYGALIVMVVSVYGAVLVGFGALINDPVAGLIGVGVVAVAIQPVHSRLRRRVERWVYGDRSDPYAAIRRLSTRVEGIADPAGVLDAVTSSVAEALRVNDVRIELDASGSARASAPDGSRVPLVHQGLHLGELVVSVPPGRQLSAADDRMLEDLARHAAAVVNAVHLTLELQLSRSRLVSAREEERRRLRRDLHDGVGPSLAAMVLKLNAISNTVDDPVADELLAQVRTETKGAIAEIRRLVDDLRPPSLDEVVLVAALRQKATALSVYPLRIKVDGPSPLLQLPAAAEVAAYRIALEAMTNVVRHSGATRCQVTVRVLDRQSGVRRHYRTGGHPAPIGHAGPAVASVPDHGRPVTDDAIRVVIADDHPAFRAGLRLMIDPVADIHIVGEATTGHAVVALAIELLPDVVVMDLRMPDVDGIEATRQLLAVAPQIGVVVLTMFEDDDSVFAAMRAGARGYLLKGAEQEEIVRAIRATASGEAIFGPSIAQRVIEHFTVGGSAANPTFPTLTDREREILELIAAGKGNGAIAHELVLTIKTVRNHVSKIFGKLQVADRAAAIVKARDAGYGAPATRPHG